MLSMGKSTISTGPFSIARLNYQSLILFPPFFYTKASLRAVLIYDLVKSQLNHPEIRPVFDLKMGYEYRHPLRFNIAPP